MAEPLAEYVAAQESFCLPETVESVVRCQTNGPLLAAAATLWIKPDDHVIDVTYGRGNFWTHYRPRHFVAHDLHTIDHVDFRQLPEADQSVDVVVFDPPYISMGGRDTSTIGQNGGGDLVAAFGLYDAPKSPAELAELIAAGIKEALRVLKPKGRLFVKCMDYVSSGGLFLGRHHVVTTALSLGFRQADEFVHHSGTGPQPTVNPDGTPRKQYHARRAHSYLCIFEAPRKRAAHIDGGGPISEEDRSDG